MEDGATVVDTEGTDVVRSFVLVTDDEEDGARVVVADERVVVV